jgi:hypothetical protein
MPRTATYRRHHRCQTLKRSTPQRYELRKHRTALFASKIWIWLPASPFPISSAQREVQVAELTLVNGAVQADGDAPLESLHGDSATAADNGTSGVSVYGDNESESCLEASFAEQVCVT